MIEEIELLIPEPEDAKIAAYLLLVNGYTVRAEATMLANFSGDTTGPFTVEKLVLYFHKTPQEQTDTRQ